MRRFETSVRALTLVALVATSACQKKLFYKPAFTEDQKLGGKTVSASVLNEGRDAYTHYCYACHGDDGDGKGPSAAGMRPPPRDFRTALFKFGGVQVGQLPHDDAIERLLRRGLDGTPMLAWDMSPRERHAIIQYIKSFSPRWREEEPGERVEVSPDPWKGKEAEAREIGKRIYHLAGVENDAAGNMKYVLAGCSNCHPSYISIDERIALSQTYTGAPPAALAELGDMYRPSLKASEYQVGDHTLQILPTDFLFHPVKNGTSLDELYRTIAAGIAGAAMPTWKGILNEEGLWALTHYVKSLTDRRGTTQALALRQKLMAQPPPPPAADEAPTP
jgi:mono/diheme cytochrome c family protein